MSEVNEAPNSALVTIETTDLVAVFTETNGVEAILKRLEADARARAAGLDISTPNGRQEIASLARTKIARSKTALLSAGKKLTEDWRKQTAAVNADCKLIETRLDALRDEVRKPLTDWENAEKARIAEHEAALAAITEAPDYGQAESATEIQTRLDALLNYPARDWQEFAQRAERAIAAEIERTRTLLKAAQQREAEAAELARLRAEEERRRQEEAERQRKEREARIAAEAAERAKREAEEKAERERLAAERKAQAEREAAARREREAQEAVERAEAARKAAEERAERMRLEAERRAEQERQAAVEAERRRAAEEAERERREAEARARNVAHKKQVNGAALSALVLAISGAHSGTHEEAAAIAKAVIVAIATNSIPHVTIQY